MSAVRALNTVRSAACQAELLRLVDDSTDRFNATLRYQGNWFCGRLLCRFTIEGRDFQFQNPYGVRSWRRCGRSRRTDNDFSEVSRRPGWLGRLEHGHRPGALGRVRRTRLS
jgi:hypothetical protein